MRSTSLSLLARDTASPLAGNLTRKVRPCKPIILLHRHFLCHTHSVDDVVGDVSDWRDSGPRTNNPVPNLGLLADTWFTDGQCTHSPKRVRRRPKIVGNAV